jgi:hypothetical protein
VGSIKAFSAAHCGNPPTPHARRPSRAWNAAVERRHAAVIAIGMSMRDDEAKRLADLNRWIELWRGNQRAPL